MLLIFFVTKKGTSARGRQDASGGSGRGTRRATGARGRCASLNQEASERFFFSMSQIWPFL